MVMKTKGEFGLIDYIKNNFSVPENYIGIGDDCAIVPPSLDEMIFSTDLLMEGVHFLREESSPEDIGWKAVAVNLSDIAAMGGTPVATFLSIALPKNAQGEWAEKFISGYTEISKLYNVPLLGGDTTSSLRDIAINVGVLGKSPCGKSLLRSKAKIGETIYVTGTLGDSAGGLKSILEGINRTAAVETLIGKHKRPAPRINEGKILLESGKTGAMMDISDGIASDLRHILKASGVGAVVDLEKLPYSKELLTVCDENNWDKYELAVSGGEDFELLFTAPEGLEIDFPVYPIGQIIQGNKLNWIINNKHIDLDYIGYKHF